MENLDKLAELHPATQVAVVIMVGLVFIFLIKAFFDD